MALIKQLISGGGFIGLIADECVFAELAFGKLARLPGTQVVASRFGLLGPRDDIETQAMAELKHSLREEALPPRGSVCRRGVEPATPTLGTLPSSAFDHPAGSDLMPLRAAECGPSGAAAD